MYLLKNFEYWLKSTSIGIFLKRFSNKKPKGLAKDYSYLANEILEKISKINQPISPMFGTLLSIVRDGGFNYADDYDFAVYDRNYFNYQLVLDMEKQGFDLKGFSVVGKSLVELTFQFKGVGVDIFLIENSQNFSIHKCPNFRLEKADKDLSENIRRKKYSSYFIVKYPQISLEESKSLGLLMPSEPQEIFSRHYGLDWKTPKKDNFIDFKEYEFVDELSMTCSGNQVDVKKYLKKNRYL